MAREWWKHAGGYLCWQYPLVRGVAGAQPRTIDALVRHDREHEWIEGKGSGWSRFGPINGVAVTCLQVKACRNLSTPVRPGGWGITVGHDLRGLVDPGYAWQLWWDW